MDKETLSNYGWIVICVLVLAVMIALATPFGDFVADAVKSTTQGLFDVNQGALDAAGIHIDNNAFADPEKDAALNPDDGTGVSNNKTYVYGNYHYKYNENNGGWTVALNIDDRTLTSYGPILESINGAPIVVMSDTFNGCGNLTEAPAIPDSVTHMRGAFNGCTSLTAAPKIPSSIISLEVTFYNCTALTTVPDLNNCTSLTDMHGTFYGCTSLTKAPKLPNSVTNMYYTFYGCTKLTTAPQIPNSVTNMLGTFHSCTSLTTAPEIPGNVTDMGSCFYGCKSLTTATVIPDSVTNLDRTFNSCTALKETVYIPCEFEGMTKADLNWYDCSGVNIGYTHNNCSHG